MTSLQFLITVITMGILVVLSAGICWWKVRKAYRSRDYMTDQLVESTRNFSRTKHSLLEAIDNMKKQLEKADSLLDDAQAQIEYNKQEMDRFLASYKRLEISLQDNITKYNNLVLQYNSLTSKMPQDGGMPI